MAMAGIIAWQDYQAITRASQERAALLDGQALAQFHAGVALVANRLSSLETHSPDAACETGNSYNSLAELLGTPNVSGLVSLDLDGNVICRSGQVPDLQPPLRWFEQVRGGQEIGFGTLGPDRLPVLAVRAPQGAVAAVILQPGWLATEALPDTTQYQEATWLLDERQEVLAARGTPAAWPPAATLAELNGASQITLRAFSAGGLRYAYASTILPGGWRLIAATSAEYDHELGVRELFVRLVELTLLLAAGLTAAVLGADVAFGHPLRRLSAAVQRWQTGAPFDPGNLSGAPDEVLELARSFRDATGVLRDKEAQLVRAQEQQNLLVLEIHHRVKNNLQVVASLLNLQASRIRVPEARAEFQAARDRVRALATLHRHLYADGGLHTINMRSFLTELCGQLFQAMGEKEGDRIQLSIEAPELRMSSDQAVPLALIVTEAVTNSIKYAFPARRTGHISVVLTVDPSGALKLVISDDGIGIPAGQQETESGTRDGIGLHLIRGFTRQLGASLVVEEGRGTRYAVLLSAQVLAAAGHDAAAPGPELDVPLDAAAAARDTAA